MAETGTATGRAVERGCRAVPGCSGGLVVPVFEEKVLKAKAARAELEAVRKQVARLKVEFSAGKRY